MSKLKDKILSFKDLEIDWNGYGGTPPSDGMIIKAMQIADWIDLDVEVFPCGDGTVEFEWETPGEFFELWVEDDDIYLCGSKGGPPEIPFDEAAIRKALSPYGTEDWSMVPKEVMIQARFISRWIDKRDAVGGTFIVVPKGEIVAFLWVGHLCFFNILLESSGCHLTGSLDYPGEVVSFDEETVKTFLSQYI